MHGGFIYDHCFLINAIQFIQIECKEIYFQNLDYKVGKIMQEYILVYLIIEEVSAMVMIMNKLNCKVTG